MGILRTSIMTSCDIVYKNPTDRFKDELHLTPVSPSKMKSIKADIESCMKNKESERLKTLFLSPFIYPDKLSEREEKVEEVDRIETKKYEDYHTRPVIEAIFFHENEFFCRLVSQLFELKASPVHEVFLGVLFSLDLFRGFTTPWDEAIFKKIDAGIRELEAFGEEKKLDARRNQASMHAKSIAGELRTHLESKPKFENVANFLVDWIYFKCKFVEILHSKDSVLPKDYGVACILKNLAIFVFSVGISHLIHWGATGHVLFFSPKKTNHVIADMDKLIDKKHLCP